MKISNVLYLPSGRIFLVKSNDNYLVECTEMRDVSISGKEHFEVRNSLNPQIIWKHLKSFQEKWLLTVSTQKGCSFNCKFCDVASLPFRGNLNQEEIETQVRILLANTSYVMSSQKVKIGFARMGEPAHNLQNVLGAMTNLPMISKEMQRDFNWLPCFNTILPKSNGIETIDKVIDIKENKFNGFLHFQISCNSTDEETRQKLFGGAMVISIERMIDYINTKNISNRTVTLNFIVMKGVEVNVNKLSKMGLNGGKFRVKLIPLNITKNAESNGLDTLANYKNYEELEKLGKQFNNLGVPTVIDAIAKCEEAGLCCGQLAQIYQ